MDTVSSKYSRARLRGLVTVLMFMFGLTKVNGCSFSCSTLTFALHVFASTNLLKEPVRAIRPFFISKSVVSLFISNVDAVLEGFKSRQARFSPDVLGLSTSSETDFSSSNKVSPCFSESLLKQNKTRVRKLTYRLERKTKIQRIPRRLLHLRLHQVKVPLSRPKVAASLL